MANGNFRGGNGSPENPFLVDDAEDLQRMAAENKINPEFHYKQTSTIDMTGIDNFNIIGDTSSGPPFMGVYDGGYHAISNLKVVSNSFYVGMFGVCSGILKNMRIIDSTVIATNASGDAGILAGVLSGDFAKNCEVSGRVKAGGNVGGLASSIAGVKIDECCAKEINVEGKFAAGFSAYMSECEVSNCYASGIVDRGSGDFGESAGFSLGPDEKTIIKNSYATVGLKNQSLEYVPLTHSFVGEDSNTIVISCYSDVENDFVLDQWREYVAYSVGSHVRGADGKVYKNHTEQWKYDYDYMGTPFPFTDATPATGSRWREFWAILPNSWDRNSEQMKRKKNYTGWNFDDVWKMKDGLYYPEIRSNSESKCERIAINKLLGGY